VESGRTPKVIADVNISVQPQPCFSESQRRKNMSDPTIQVLPKGPYLVAGKFALLDASGKKIEAGEKIALCRCGASTNKPFCDGTHSKIGFDAAAAAVPGSAE
jgi:3-phenylpropionate/trans-cinnamate dioxygenase ferredoxin subunit